jgi:hypothetical protein
MGNNLFQYVFARLLAEANDLHLDTEWCSPDFIQVTTPRPGGKVYDPVMSFTDMTRLGKKNYPYFNHRYHARIYLNGYFQHASYYDFQREHIRKFFILPEAEKRDEVIMHVRLGDYRNKRFDSVIHPSWYHAAIERAMEGKNGKRLHILCEDPTDKYLKEFDRYDPFIVPPISVRHDFNVLRCFNTIICSNSSFCWWAAFLSDASKIYTFAPWIRPCPWVTLGRTRGMIPLNGRFEN